MAVVGVVAAMVAGISVHSAGASHPEYASTRKTLSYYVTTTSSTALYNLGCILGNLDGELTLLFGAPVGVSGEYGASLWGGANQNLAGVAFLAKRFIVGWDDCNDSGSYLIVGVGTSNSAIDDNSDSWLGNHGDAWNDMVVEIASWAATYHPDALGRGAWDVEPAWSNKPKAEQWLQGYQQAGSPALHFNASADGCPQTTANNGACNNGWDQQDLYHLGWVHSVSFPAPQIYAESGANAKQWQKISEWGYHNDALGEMYFFGSMSQNQACIQTGGCSGTQNTRHGANSQLLAELQSHSHTTQSGVYYATDIQWY